MKKFIFPLLLIGSVQADEIRAYAGDKLTWDHPMPAIVSEYRLYCDGSQIWSGPEMVTPTLGLLAQFTHGQLHTCHVTAANKEDESDPSNSLSFHYVDAAPPAPSNLRMEFE